MFTDFFPGHNLAELLYFVKKKTERPGLVPSSAEGFACPELPRVYSERSRGIHPECNRGKPRAKFSFFFLPHRLICSSRLLAELWFGCFS